MNFERKGAKQCLLNLFMSPNYEGMNSREILKIDQNWDFFKNALELNPYIQDQWKLHRNASEAFYYRNKVSGSLIQVIHEHVCLS